MEKTSNYSQICDELKNYQQAILVAVSKTRSLEQILDLYLQGQRVFGENRVDELYEKSFSIDKEVEWHFIGRLQTNKINKLLQVKNLKAIHSIDRLGLVESLLKKDSDIDKPVELFLQFNTSEEKEKAGFTSEEELIEAIKLIVKSKNFPLRGLMTMGKIRTDNPEADARHCFKRLRAIKNSLISKGIVENLDLSMGMSGDYKIALEEGSTVIRVGSALFS